MRTAGSVKVFLRTNERVHTRDTIAERTPALEREFMDPSQLTEFLVFIRIKPGCEDEFLRGARANRAGSVQEPGNLRFDMYRSTQDPCDYLFAEKYNSVEAVTAHRQTPHFLTFFKVLESVQEFPRRREPGSEIPAHFEPIPETA